MQRLNHIFAPGDFSRGPIAAPSSFPNKRDKQGDHKYNSTTHKLKQFGRSRSISEYRKRFVQSIDEVSKSEAEERRSKSSNNDVRQLLMEVEVLKCELDSNQEELSRCRRANTVLKRNCHYLIIYQNQKMFSNIFERLSSEYDV